ncbi:uncharacterized protein KY384_004190 [Bacidia gigantensis]|uniref:uncharacterized protein n=1 Tax=Bacidia gigantensis TaxID=2732470 RepID=UPI001D045ED0|nr:uncharacterized protein KY384_004190 [Bacidia gigantensis]KAG8530833.1 hypothetical protein KY384_004190 [Bacidia gigantensis]
MSRNAWNSRDRGIPFAWLRRGLPRLTVASVRNGVIVERASMTRSCIDPYIEATAVQASPTVKLSDCKAIFHQMSKITDITSDSAFHDNVSSLPPSTLAVISFHTPWAAPCKQMRLILETLASSYPMQDPLTISFISLDAEALPDISESYDVTAVPFLVVQKNDKVLESVSGSDASKIRDAVERHAGKSGNTGKFGLPPALETTPRENGHDERQASEPAGDLSAYAPKDGDPATAPDMSSTEGGKEELNQRLGELVKAAPVMLFMKGTPSSPQCGFSKQLVNLLREKGVRYGFFNILADDDVRQGLKEYSDWPTFPQLYLQGELVGGLDIVKEELETNEDFFSDFQAAPAGKGGMAASEDQRQPIST